MLELLQYLAHAGISSAKAVITGSWSNATDEFEAAESVTLATFPVAIDRAYASLETLLGETTDAHLTDTQFTLPWGQEVSVGAALIDLALKFFVAYRLQLFLYVKATADPKVWTPDCWAGVHMDKDTSQNS